MTYPSAIPDLSDGAVNVAGGHGKVRDALAAVLTELGANPSGSAATVADRLAAISLTVQDDGAQVATEVKQIDFQGAGVTVSSGTGEVVVTIPGGTGTGTGGYSPPADGIPRDDLAADVQLTLDNADTIVAQAPYASTSHTHSSPVIFLAEGAAVPAGTPANTLVARYSATSAFGFGAEVGRAVGTSVTATAGVTFTAASTLAVGDTVVIGVAASGTGGILANWTVTAGTNTFTAAQRHIQGTSAQSALLVCKLTQAISAGGSITVKPDTTLDDLAVIGASVLGAASSPVDQVMTNGAGSATAFSIGPTATTTAADEVAFAAFCWLPGEPDTRTFTPTGAGVVQVGATAKNTDTSPRALALVYRVLTTTQTVTLAGSISGTASVYSGSLATIKKA